MLTSHCSHRTAWCSQLTAHSSHLTAWCSQLTAHSSHLTAPSTVLGQQGVEQSVALRTMATTQVTTAWSRSGLPVLKMCSRGCRSLSAHQVALRTTSSTSQCSYTSELAATWHRLIIILYSIVPTFLELASINLTHVQFGKSLVPQLKGGGGDINRAVFAEGGYR